MQPSESTNTTLQAITHPCFLQQVNVFVVTAIH
jgi:hypothetical protein